MRTTRLARGKAPIKFGDVCPILEQAFKGWNRTRVVGAPWLPVGPVVVTGQQVSGEALTPAGSSSRLLSGRRGAVELFQRSTMSVSWRAFCGRMDGFNHCGFASAARLPGASVAQARVWRADPPDVVFSGATFSPFFAAWLASVLFDGTAGEVAPD